MPPCARSSSSRRYGSGCGSPAGRAKAGTRKGASASSVTTQGLTEVAKLLARNGPERLVLPLLQVARRPVVEQAQAEELALGLGERDRLAERVARADEGAHLELVVERAARAEARRAARAAARSGPAGRAIGVPLTTSDEARPW